MCNLTPKTSLANPRKRAISQNCMAKSAWSQVLRGFFALLTQPGNVKTHTYSRCALAHRLHTIEDMTDVTQTKEETMSKGHKAGTVDLNADVSNLTGQDLLIEMGRRSSECEARKAFKAKLDARIAAYRERSGS